MAHPRREAFQAYIGPRYVPSNAETNYGKWDYATALSTGPIALPYVGQETLAGALSEGAITGLTLPGGWPVQGGAWVGPGSATQGWEYIAYHSSGSALQRNPQLGTNNSHSAGSPFYFWYPLSTNIGKLDISIEQSDNMAVRQWTAKLSGVNAPTSILKPDHYIVITRDSGTPAAMNDEDYFQVFMVGIVERVSMSQDFSRSGQWEIEISSMASVLQASNIPGLRIGPMDIALEAEADASSSLGAAWKLTLSQKQQAEDGLIPEIDLVEVQQDMSPGNALDGNQNTLWVSDGWLAPPSWFANTPGHNSWASIFAFPPPQHIIGSRYIEIINHDGLDGTWMWMYYKYSYPGGDHARWIQISEPNMFEQNGVGAGDSFTNVEDRLIIAENGEVFNKLFPSANPRYFIDAATLSGPEDMEAVRRLWWEGGAIFMAWTYPGSSGEGYLWHWGAVTYGELETAWATQGTTDFSLPASNYYLNLDTVKPGQVFRRNLAAPIVSNPNEMEFSHDYLHHPGYVISNNPGGDYPEWFKVTLPEMMHILRDNITSATTTVYLVDAQGNPNVEGISRGVSAGAVYINGEIVTFTGKDYDLGTLTGCTVPSTHKAGSRVYVRWQIPWYGTSNPKFSDPYNVPFKDKLFDNATAGFPISKIKWGRGYYANGDDRTPYIGSMVMRFSLYPDARVPPDDSHESDYLSECIVDSDSYSPTISGPNVSVQMDHPLFDDFDGDGFRPRTILMEFRSMNKTGTGDVTAARPRLNYLVAEVDRDFFNPSNWLTLPEAGMENYLFTYYVLLKSGIYLSAVNVIDPYVGPSPKRFRGMTDSGTAWRVGADAAEYGSTVIDVGLRGGITVSPNQYLLNSSHTPVRTLENDEITRIEIAVIRPAVVGQMRVEWEDPVNGLEGVAVYPATVPGGSEVTTVGPILATDQTEADTICYNLYTTRRFAYNVFVELDSFDDSISMGDIHVVNYDFDLKGQMMQRVLLVESIEHAFDNMTGKTVIGYREIERETV